MAAGPPPHYAPPAHAPPKLKYREGDPIPPGYHLEEHARMGPIITGYAVGGSAYGIGLLAGAADGFDNEKGYLLLPVLGPWLTLSQRQGCADSYIGCDFFAPLMLVMSGLMQGAGATLILVGHAAPRTWLVRDDVTVSVLPVPMGEQGYGAALTGTF